jgi:hypothetical protein
MSQRPFLEKFVAIIEKTELSDSTKDNYKRRMQKLVTMTNKDLDWVLANCKKTLEIMEKNGVTEPQSVKALLSVIVALFKHAKQLKAQMPKAYKCWLAAFLKINEIVESKYDNLEPSEKQVDAYVPWSDIIKRRDELDKDGNEHDKHLILSLYTMIPPARADLNMIRIYRNTEPKESDKAQYPNFLLINATGKKKVTMTLVYNEFKSKSKFLQLYEKVLPANLIEVIEASLKRQPREFLIVSPSTKKPFDKPNSYTKYFNRILKDIFKNKDMSINTLRHSYVMSVNFNTLTPAQKESIAKDMMHSPDMFDRYRFNLPASNSQDGKEKVCEVVCKDKDK